MVENETMKDAINTFVNSLETEQKKSETVGTKKKDEDFLGFEKLKNSLKKIVELICVGEEIKLESDSGKSEIGVYGKDLGIAIGKNGQNIEAIEYIINLIGKRKNLIDRKVVIDIKDYRKKNLEKIKKIALKMANKAIKEGRKIALRPMPSYERKIIHNLLSEMKNVKTFSRDEEPNRRIIIFPVQES